MDHLSGVVLFNQSFEKIIINHCDTLDPEELKIAVQEMLQLVLTIRQNYEKFRRTEIVICIDNRTDLGSTIKGRHKSALKCNTPLNRLIALFWLMAADLRSTVRMWYIPTEKNIADLYSRRSTNEMIKIKDQQDSSRFDIEFFDKKIVDEISEIALALEQGVYIRASWLKNF